MSIGHIEPAAASHHVSSVHHEAAAGGPHLLVQLGSLFLDDLDLLLLLLNALVRLGGLLLNMGGSVPIGDHCGLCIRGDTFHGLIIVSNIDQGGVLMDLSHIGLLKDGVVPGIIINARFTVMSTFWVRLVDKVDPVGGPDVVAGVELEQDEEGEEDAGHPGYVGCHQQVLGAGAEVVVEVVDVDVHGEQDGRDHHEDVVAHQLLGDGVVQGGGPGGGRVELGEGVHQQLARRQEQVHSDQAEQLACNLRFFYYCGINN